MSKLPYRKPLVPNLGQLIGPVLRAARAYEDRCLSIDEDLQAFHAPSECGTIAYNGAYQDLCLAVAEAVAASGFSRRELVAEIKARTGGRWWDWTTYSMGLPSNLLLGER